MEIEDEKLLEEEYSRENAQNDPPLEEVTENLSTEKIPEDLEESGKEGEEQSSEGEEKSQDSENAEGDELFADGERQDGLNGEASDESKPQENGGKKRKKKHKKISDITFENDIKYRGPFSYRWLRIFAWVAIVCTQAALILQLGMRVDAKIARDYVGLAAFLGIFGTVSVPLFLVANFAIIINAKNGYKRLLGAYAFMSLIIFALFMLIYQRYLLGIVGMLATEEGKSPQETFNGIFLAFSKSGFIAFNIFIDLFLCTLFTYFVNYTPKSVFVGKKLIIFRLFAIIPVLYEVASLTLKMLVAVKADFILPLYVSPFLTTKPPLTFIVFVVLAFFIKGRERMFLKRGKTQEEYGKFLKTNVNSLHFSIAASVCMAVAAILDIILYFIIGSALTIVGEDETVLRDGMEVAYQMGFGRSIPLLLVIPFIMLFSYTRTHKPSAIDMVIPNVGMVAFAICYVEGLYQLILRLPQIIDGLLK